MSDERTMIEATIRYDCEKCDHEPIHDGVLDKPRCRYVRDNFCSKMPPVGRIAPQGTPSDRL